MLTKTAHLTRTSVFCYCTWVRKFLHALIARIETSRGRKIFSSTHRSFVRNAVVVEMIALDEAPGWMRVVSEEKFSVSAIHKMLLIEESGSLKYARDRAGLAVEGNDRQLVHCLKVQYSRSFRLAIGMGA